jgi:endoglucanase
VKKLRTYLFCAISAISMMSNVQAQYVKTHGQLHVDGTRLVDANNETIVLRGMSFGWHNFWPRFYNESAVSWLKTDWNVKVVRAAMGVDIEDGYMYDSAGSVQKVFAVVDAAIANDIYVIIDWHCHNIQLDAAKGFFAMAAAKYGEYPNVIFEIYNEPDHESWADVKAYSEEVIKTIRAEDKDNVILVGSPHWDQDIHLVAADPLVGFDNIMYTLHFYAATHGQELRDRSDSVLVQGLPLFVSESGGMDASGDGALSYEQIDAWIAWMEKNSISWVCWSISDKDETCSVLNKSASSKGNWKTSDVKEWGQVCRERLRAK